MIKWLSLVLLTSCYKEPVDIVQDQPAIVRKVQLYSELTESFRDNNGFIQTDGCDSLLFSGLLGAAEPGTLTYSAAYDISSDQWRRNPDFSICSLAIGDARSTISRDMVLGLMWSIWRNKDLETAQDLLEHVRKHGYRMNGEGTIGELALTPTLINTLARMVVELGGEAAPGELVIPAVFFPEEGFSAHLATWHILLRGEIRGKISAHEFGILETNRNRAPLNPLYQAAYHKYSDGDQSQAIDLLLNQPHWPADRLPTGEDRCEPWLLQRDVEQANWYNPCVTPAGKAEKYSGGDLIAVYKLVIQSTKGTVDGQE